MNGVDHDASCLAAREPADRVEELDRYLAAVGACQAWTGSVIRRWAPVLLEMFGWWPEVVLAGHAWLATRDEEQDGSG